MIRSNKSISIIGCGWLGFALAKKLIGIGWQVKGTTTKVEKIAKMNAEGIESFLFNSPGCNSIDRSLFNSEAVLINIPPGRSKKSNLDHYEQSIDEILINLKSAKKVRKLIFVSSTSVYGSEEDIFYETSETHPESESGKTLLRAEKKIITSNISYIILRFGGLAGPGRHPGRFLSGKTELTTGCQSVNFLHLEDAIGVIQKLLERDIHNDIFNVAAPKHPLKKDFYTKMALLINLPPPVFDEDSRCKKREISIEKLLKTIGYRFVYPNPLNFKF